MGYPKAAPLLGFGEFSVSVRLSARPSVTCCMLQTSTIPVMQGKPTQENLRLEHLLGHEETRKNASRWGRIQDNTIGGTEGRSSSGNPSLGKSLEQ
jgi:hypothetical protein